MVENEAVAVRGTRRAMKELVDGTIRVQIDIDPPHRADFLRLFPNIDMPVVLAAMNVRPPQNEVKGGPLARLAGTFCASADFQEWCECDDEAGAATYVRQVCGVTSRAMLDSNEQAAEIFHRCVRVPFTEREK